MSLHIENIAVIKKLDIDFNNGFTVLTGETGAGKSIIIDSISLLLGAKTSRTLIRSGESSAEVSAMFCVNRSDNAAALDLLGISGDDDGIIYVKRTISEDGKSQTKVNGKTIPVSLQREAFGLLLNIHGQHENQRLLDFTQHLGYLDKFASDEEKIKEFQASYETANSIKREIEKLNISDKDKEREIQMLKYQLEDINAAKLRIGEEEELQIKRSRIQNIEKIEKQANIVYHSLYRAEKGSSASDLIQVSIAALSQLADVLEDSEIIAEKLENYRYEIEEIAERAYALIEDETGDPSAALDKIENRLDIIFKLKKKYGDSIAEILSFGEKAEQRLSNIELSELRIKELSVSYAEAEEVLKKHADELHNIRLEAAEKLSDEVTEQLAFLDMQKVKFKVEVKKTNHISPSGGDEINFMISTNPGEPLMPLEKIASGGELSRVMLALKSVLSSCEGTETLIFDEVDTGISGRTSHKIGLKLKQTSNDAQVLCVTHSPQIAALADTHLFISKTENGGRTETALKELDYNGRIDELARIMGSDKITDTLKKTAEEMINFDTLLK